MIMPTWLEISILINALLVFLWIRAKFMAGEYKCRARAWEDKVNKDAVELARLTTEVSYLRNMTDYLKGIIERYTNVEKKWYEGADEDIPVSYRIPRE